MVLCVAEECWETGDPAPQAAAAAEKAARGAETFGRAETKGESKGGTWQKRSTPQEGKIWPHHGWHSRMPGERRGRSFWGCRTWVPVFWWGLPRQAAYTLFSGLDSTPVNLEVRVSPELAQTVFPCFPYWVAGFKSSCFFTFTVSIPCNKLASNFTSFSSTFQYLSSLQPPCWWLQAVLSNLLTGDSLGLLSLLSFTMVMRCDEYAASSPVPAETGGCWLINHKLDSEVEPPWHGIHKKNPRASGVFHIDLLGARGSRLRGFGAQPRLLPVISTVRGWTSPRSIGGFHKWRYPQMDGL